MKSILLSCWVVGLTGCWAREPAILNFKLLIFNSLKFYEGEGKESLNRREAVDLFGTGEQYGHVVPRQFLIFEKRLAASAAGCGGVCCREAVGAYGGDGYHLESDARIVGSGPVTG